MCSSILHFLQLEIIHVKSDEFFKTLPTTFTLYAKYQTRIHNDPPTEEKEYLDFLQRSPLKVELSTQSFVTFN